MGEHALPSQELQGECARVEAGVLSFFLGLGGEPQLLAVHGCARGSCDDGDVKSW